MALNVAIEKQMLGQHMVAEPFQQWDTERPFIRGALLGSSLSIILIFKENFLAAHGILKTVISPFLEQVLYVNSS